MASDEEEDLAALRSAVLASMLQPLLSDNDIQMWVAKAAVIPKEEAQPPAPLKSDSEDDEDDLAALRAAALLSKRKKSMESSQDSRRNSSDKFSNSRSGSNGTANLKPIPPQNVESIKSHTARSQNRWGGSLNSSPASTPTKPNVGRKFSRLLRSDSESEESDDEPVTTDTKKSDDELGSDVDIHLGFDAKEIPNPSPEIEEPTSSQAPARVPVDVPVPVAVPAVHVPSPVRVKTEPLEMDDKSMVYQDIDERQYNHRRLNDFGHTYADPVVIDEHGDVDMRRVETHLKPPKLQIQVNMDGAGDRRRVQVADVGPVQQMFRVTVTNLNQQRNILLEGADGCLFQDGMGMPLGGRLRPIDDLSVLDARRMIVPRLEQEQPKPLADGEQYGNGGYWDTAEQFRKRNQSYEGKEVPWSDVNNYQAAHKAIETDHYSAEKTTGKLYMDRESSKFADREEKPKLRSIQPDHYSDSDSKTDSLLPGESVSTREHDIAVNAEYWVTADQTTERVVKRGGKVKHKSDEKVVKRKSRSPRAEKVKTSKDSKNRSRVSKKRQPEPESSPDRYSGDESEITTSRDTKQEPDDSFSESEQPSSRERSPSESEVKNSDTIDDDSKFSDIYSEDVSSVSHKANRPASKKKNREPEPPVRTRKNSARSPKQVVDKDKLPRGRREFVQEHVKNVKGRRARNDEEEFDRSKSRDRGEGLVQSQHAKEKNIRLKADIDEKVRRTKVERVRKSKMVYEEEEEAKEKPVRLKKSRITREVSDEESSPERPVKNKRSVRDVAGVKRDQPIKKKLIEAPVDRASRPKQRSPRKKLTPEPVEPKRSPGNRMYRSRKLPEEEGEITDEESEERVCKPVKLRSKDQLKMREAIGECSRKLHALLRREEKEEGELDESPVETNRKALKGLKEEKEEGELSEGPSDRKRKVKKSQKLVAPDSDEEERQASRKLQKLRKDKAKGSAEPGDKVELVADKKSKSKVAASEEQSGQKLVEETVTVAQKLKTSEDAAKSKTGKEISSDKSESGDKNDSDTSAKSSKSKKSLEGKAAKSDVATKASATENIPVPEQAKTPGPEEKKAAEKASKKVESGKAAKGKKTDDEESGVKWKKVGEGEEDRALSPLQEVLEEANKEVEDATKEAAVGGEEKDKTAGAKFKKFQLEKLSVKKGAKSEEEAKSKAAPAKKPTEPKKLDKAGLKLSETKEKLLKILAQGKLKTQDAAKKAGGKPGQKDDAMNFSAGLEAIVQRKGVADSRKKVTATKTVKKSATKRKKNISKSPVRKKSSKSSRSRHRESRSRSRSSSTTSYSDRRKSRRRRRRRYSSTESSRSRYSSTSYSRRSRSRSRRRSYSRRRSRSRSSSYSRRRSHSRSRRRSRSRKRSSSESRSSSRTRSSSRSGSTSSTRSSSHSRSTRSSSTGSTSSTSSASSKDSDDNAAWRFKHTGKSAKAGQTKSEIFERKRTDIENEQKKKQNKNFIDKELPDDRRGNYDNRNDDRPWRGGHDFRYNNNNGNRGRFMYHDNRQRFNDFGGFRGPGRYQRDWHPRGGGGGYRDFRDYRQDNNFRDFRNQNRDRPPYIRRNRSWSSERGSDKGASPERSRSKDKKDKSKRSKSRDDSKDTENKRSRSRESGAQTKTAGANKAKVNPPPKFDADREKEKDHSDTEGSQQGENKRDKEKLPVHKRLGSQLGNVIPAKMNRRPPDNEPDPEDDKELEARIERIRQQNAKILQRRREVEQDKRAHGKKHEKRKDAGDLAENKKRTKSIFFKYRTVKSYVRDSSNKP